MSNRYEKTGRIKLNIKKLIFCTFIVIEALNNLYDIYSQIQYSTYRLYNELTNEIIKIKSCNQVDVHYTQIVDGYYYTQL